MNIHIIALTVIAMLNSNIDMASASQITNSYEFNYERDTLTYLRDIESEKSKYTNKNLSLLLKDLNVPIKSYAYKKGSKPVAAVQTIILYFESQESRVRKYKVHSSTFYLTISFEKELVHARALYFKNSGIWGQAEKDYFGNLIITDINSPIKR